MRTVRNLDVSPVVDIDLCASRLGGICDAAFAEVDVWYGNVHSEMRSVVLAFGKSRAYAARVRPCAPAGACVVSREQRRARNVCFASYRLCDSLSVSAESWSQRVRRWFAPWCCASRDCGSGRRRACLIAFTTCFLSAKKKARSPLRGPLTFSRSCLLTGLQAIRRTAKRGSAFFSCRWLLGSHSGACRAATAARTARRARRFREARHKRRREKKGRNPAAYALHSIGSEVPSLRGST
jgi:hypothetical protein